MMRPQTHSQSLPGKKQSTLPFREEVRLSQPQPYNPMPSTKTVPCYFTGQDYRRERPVAQHTRAEVRAFKARMLGRFAKSGQVFVFFATMHVEKKLWDGPMGVGNLLPFAKAHSLGDPLHYEMPMAGDRTCFARHRRRRIRVSGRLAPELRRAC
jgi:hypothetical protein